MACSRCGEDKVINFSGLCNRCRKDVVRVKLACTIEERDNLVQILTSILEKDTIHNGWELEAVKAKSLLLGIKKSDSISFRGVC